MSLIAECQATMSEAEKTTRNSPDVLIGRAKEYSRLHDACFGASVGKGGFLLLEAESGLGKSLLLDQLKQNNEQKGLFFLQGQGVTLSASKPLDLFRGCSRDIALRMEQNENYREKILSELELPERRIIAKALPELALSLEVPKNSYADLIPHGNWVTLSTLSRMIDILGDPISPAIIVLDDCQWADPFSLTLIRHWLEHNRKNSASPSHTLVIGASRSEDLEDGHILLEMPSIDHVKLEPLTPQETAELVKSSLGEHTTQVASSIYSISQGNPFLSQSVIQNLRESNTITQEDGIWAIRKEERTATQPASHTLSFLKKRFEHLRPESILLLQAAAILGKGFSLQQLKRVHEIESQALTECLADAEHRHLISKISDEHYAFTHDKLREALLEMAEESTRKRVHLCIAQMLEESDTSNAFDIAYHYDAAGRPEPAVKYAVQAAKNALETHALEAAEEQYRIALKGATTLPEEKKREIHIGLARVLLLTGKYSEAEQLFREACELTTDTNLLAQFEMFIGEIHFKRGEYSQSVEAYARGLQKLGESLPSGKFQLWLLLTREIAKHIKYSYVVPAISKKPLPPMSETERLKHQLYVRLSYVAYFHFSIDRTVYCHLSALNIAESRKISVELLQSVACHGMAMSLMPGMPMAEKFGKRSLALQNQVQSLWHKGQALHMLGDVYYAASKFGSAIEACSEAVKIFRTTGDLWEMNIANSNVAYALYRTGNLREAAAVAEEAFHTADQIGDITAAASLLSVWSRATAGDIPVIHLKKYLEITENLKKQPYTETLCAYSFYALRHSDMKAAHHYAKTAFTYSSKLLFPAEYVFSSLPLFITTARMRIGDFRKKAHVPLKLLMQARYVLLRSYFLRNSLPHMLREYALLLALSGKRRKSVTYLKKSMAKAQKQNAQYEYAISNLCLKRLEASQNPTKTAEVTAALETLSACSKDLTLLCKTGLITEKEFSSQKTKERDSERIELRKAI